MPIKNLNKRLVETYKIKIGGKGEERKGKKGKYRLPVKYDHFVVTGLDKDGSDNFIPDPGITEALGAKPKKLAILLMTDDIDKNFQTAYACYKGSKRFCMGDGETAERRQPNDTFKQIQCDPETCPIYAANECKPSGILSCMLPQSEKVGGVAKFRTHSWNTIINITSSLEAIKLITGGVLFGIPLTMELIEKQTEEHGKVKVVNIVYNGSMQKLQLAAGQQKQLRLDGSVSMTGQNAVLEQSGVLVDRDDPVDIETEYYIQDQEPDQAETIQQDLQTEPEPEQKAEPKKSGSDLF